MGGTDFSTKNWLANKGSLIGMLSPEVPEPPPVEPPPDPEEEEKEKNAREAARRRKIRSKGAFGFSDTVKTGPLGITGDGGQTSGKSLLGG